VEGGREGEVGEATEKEEVAAGERMRWPADRRERGGGAEGNGRER
jgi:hypothetical protein